LSSAYALAARIKVERSIDNFARILSESVARQPSLPIHRGVVL